MPEVYTIDLAGVAGVPSEWLAVLDDGERARAGAFVHAHDQMAFVAAHALKRLVLARMYPGQALRFVTNAFGKPFVADGAALQFNLSHTTGMAAVAVSSRTPVGIDVEARGSALRYRDAMRSVLSSVELAELESASDWEQAFLALWTAKEAVIKAEGKGLSLPLAGIAIHPDRGIGPSRSWTLWRSRPTPHHVLAVAWDGSDDAVDLHALCADELTALVPGGSEPLLRASFHEHTEASVKPDHRGYRNAKLH